MLQGAFSFDGKLVTLLAKVWGLFLVSFLWLMASLPVVTMGVATSALFKAVDHCIIHDKGFVIATFFSGFMEDFKRKTLSWLFYMFLGLIFLVDVIYFRNLLMDGNAIGVVYISFIFLLVILFLTMTYTVLYIMRVEDGLKATLKNSFALVIGHPLSSLKLLLATGLIFLMAYALPPLLLMVPGLYGLVTYHMTKHVLAAHGVLYETDC